MLDHLTKFVILRPISSGTSQQIVNILVNDLFCVFGVPQTIHSDNGPQFKSTEYKHLLEEYGVVDSKTAIYSPQSNLSERVNRSVLAAIRSYIKDKHTHWDKHLHEIASALRNGVHETVKNSPHFLLFGYHKINHATDYKMLQELGEISEGEIHDQAKRDIENAYVKSANRYNLRSKIKTFDIGQFVYVRTHPQSDAVKKLCAKFAPQFTKGKIIQKIGNVNYKVESSNGQFLGVFHGKDITA